uniref:NRF domain-containing protein n=1 Tax=Panagrellus redivivus TaxID=6233 RepID=A0A7E4V514_PANRE
MSAIIWLSIVGTAAASFQGLPFKQEKIDYIKLTDYEQLARASNGFSYADSEIPTLKNLIQRLVEDPSPIDNLGNSTCGRDLTEIVNDFLAILDTAASTNFTKTVLKLLDSSGKPGAGILKGHTHWFGLFKSCQQIEYNFEDRVFNGRYSQVTFLPSAGPATPELCAKTTFTIDLCIPKSCSSVQLKNIIEASFNASFICSVSSLMEFPNKPTAGTWITVAIIAIVLFLGITASIYDFFIYKHHRDHRYIQSLGMRCWRSFSLYTNVVEIFNTKGANKPGNIGPLHCMRFFSMVWVVLGHSMAFFAFMSSNPIDVFAMNQHRITEVLTSAFFAVDTFFWQSGLLLSFVWFKKYKQNPKQSMAPLAWIMFYVHRIIRLSPPYYILIAFYTWVFSPFGTQNMAVFSGAFKDACPQNWWIDFLYLNNAIRYKDQCYLVSWYLSTDMQMYIFAPLILVPFAFGKLFGVTVALLVFAASTGINIFQMLHYYFPPTDYGYATMDPRMTVPYTTYTVMMYDAPWIRCQIYIVGMLTGVFMQTYKKLKIPWFFQVIGWIGTLAIVYGCIFTLKDWINGTVLPIGWSTVYSAASKPLWGVALSWVVITCYYGYGSFINSFMSWSIWVPLGRLTYSTYLVHIIVLIYISGQNQQAFVFANFFQMLTLYIIPIIVCAYLFSILWASAFEFAFGKLEMVLIGSLLGKPGPLPVRPRATTLDPPAGGEPRTPTDNHNHPRKSFTIAVEQARANGVNGLHKRNGHLNMPGDHPNVEIIKIKKIDDDDRWT